MKKFDDINLDCFYKNDFQHAIEEAIKFEFPLIKNLIVKSKGDIFSIQFDDDGAYTKKQVEDKLQEIRNFTFKK
ncbi:MAG: hypothetical protein V4549_07595 [Bacteroidota bacterium]